ncbi:uncharacterized protein PADG_03253 [Paracoccidioides brasiliensis Pb18]|uniref:Uncharacterized protein n=1 Tax=Paracoccidioides brasiliensis (strain Pb18) TaxID=502780 RepID=C1G7U8_PARBD|nr:uncharacterized protein PADG_03253 [Paracoccidioides brasiliensis Pb18]EEH47155.2 hypothetical protein PADG_03253 [Paracoccidioides brasiliensis Pb18]
MTVSDGCSGGGRTQEQIVIISIFHLHSKLQLHPSRAIRHSAQHCCVALARTVRLATTSLRQRGQPQDKERQAEERQKRYPSSLLDFLNSASPAELRYGQGQFLWYSDNFKAARAGGAADGLGSLPQRLQSGVLGGQDTTSSEGQIQWKIWKNRGA